METLADIFGTNSIFPPSEEETLTIIDSETESCMSGLDEEESDYDAVMEGKFKFGDIFLDRVPLWRWSNSSKRFATIDTIYMKDDPIQVPFRLAVTKWCTYSECLEVILQTKDRSLLLGWEAELRKFFSGANRRYGWIGKMKTNETGEPMIKIFPTDEWNGSEIPAGIIPWSYD